MVRRPIYIRHFSNPTNAPVVVQRIIAIPNANASYNPLKVWASELNACARLRRPHQWNGDDDRLRDVFEMENFCARRICPTYTRARVSNGLAGMTVAATRPEPQVLAE